MSCTNKVLAVKDISLIDAPGTVQFLVSQLKVDVGMPSLLLRLPLYPAFKHLTATWGNKSIWKKSITFSKVPEGLLAMATEVECMCINISNRKEIQREVGSGKEREACGERKRKQSKAGRYTCIYYICVYVCVCVLESVCVRERERVCVCVCVCVCG